MKKTSMGNPLQRRLSYFGLNLIVMAVSFMLYYMGFFGRVEGPLSPHNIGKSIASLGITSNGVQAIVCILFLIALTWNWIFNLLAHLVGQRLTCSHAKGKKLCGELVQRSRAPEGHWVYTCPHGHCRKEAHFHPLRKGTFANSVLMVTLAICVAYFAS